MVAFNLAAGLATFGFWHLMTYGWPTTSAALAPFKYDPADQYAAGTTNLRREVALQTLGWHGQGITPAMALALSRQIAAGDEGAVKFVSGNVALTPGMASCRHA